jgi:hypothetical protein
MTVAIAIFSPAAPDARARSTSTNTKNASPKAIKPPSRTWSGPAEYGLRQLIVDLSFDRLGPELDLRR